MAFPVSLSCHSSSFYQIFQFYQYVTVGAMLELSEAIRAYHDDTGLPQMVSQGY